MLDAQARWEEKKAQIEASRCVDFSAVLTSLKTVVAAAQAGNAPPAAPVPRASEFLNRQASVITRHLQQHRYPAIAGASSARGGGTITVGARHPCAAARQARAQRPALARGRRRRRAGRGTLSHRGARRRWRGCPLRLQATAAADGPRAGRADGAAARHCE